MSPKVSELSFEEAIEYGLLQNGPDAPEGDKPVVRETPSPYGEGVPGGYHKRLREKYDRVLCLIPKDVVDFILATQPMEWQKLKQHHGAEIKDRLLKRLAR